MSHITSIPQYLEYPTNLPHDDGVPLETPIHRENMNILIDSADVAMGKKKDYFVGGNMFLYYSPDLEKTKDFRGPDFFLVKGVDGKRERNSWILWEENWKYPNIIIELLSATTYKTDLVDKKELYEQIFRTSEYIVYDPKEPSYLRGWRLNKYGFYEELEKNEEGWLYSKELDCYLGVWSGQWKGKSMTYLRMYDRYKKLIILEYERAEKERERAEREFERAEKELMQKEKLAKKLQELGFDPNKIIES